MTRVPPLELKKYFFPFVQVAADAEYEPSAKKISPHFEVRTTVEHDEENGIYQVALEIFAEPEDEKSKIPYSIHLITVGLFTVDENFPDREKLLKVTGASLLYSAAREFIITVTSRGPWPQVIIPTISFLQQETKKTNQLDADKTKKATATRKCGKRKPVFVKKSQ